MPLKLPIKGNSDIGETVAMQIQEYVEQTRIEC